MRACTQAIHGRVVASNHPTITAKQKETSHDPHRFPAVLDFFGNCGGTCSAADAARFTRIVPVEAKILAAVPAFPGGHYNAENIVKPVQVRGRPVPHGEYASSGQGVRTFIDFDLGRPLPIAAFRHVQRRTADTIAEAKLLFSDRGDFSTSGLR